VQKTPEGKDMHAPGARSGQVHRAPVEDARVTPARLAAALPPSRHPVVLEPAHVGGWFGGKALASWDAVLCERGVTVGEAAAYLDASYAGTGHGLCVVLAEYDGRCTVLCYDGHVVLDDEGWTAVGEIDLAPLGDVESSPEPTELAEDTALIGKARGEMGAQEYVAAVRAIQDSIRAGEVYLVNLTYRVRGRRVLAPGDAYATLVSRASSMMNAFFSDGETSLASVSPERFLSLVERPWEDGGGSVAEIWPIKGTRPRSECADCDVRFAEELQDSEKERAEHVMVVDLERNDLGRVSRTGSVSVDPLMDVAQTPYCHQMYSTVRGVVDGSQPVARLLEAAFPCGSVTGTPKIAAMGVIDSLELSPRGPYTGSLIAAVPGELDGSVLIRTLVDRGEDVEWGTGGGITIDSDAFEEWRETLLKSRPVLGTTEEAD
jgi:anthranilate/para-aminobenzoate synthase component I